MTEQDKADLVDTITHPDRFTASHKKRSTTMTTSSSDPDFFFSLLRHAPGCPQNPARMEITGQIDETRQVPNCCDCGAHFPPPDGVQRGPLYDGDARADYDRALARRLEEMGRHA